MEELGVKVLSNADRHFQIIAAEKDWEAYKRVNDMVKQTADLIRYVVKASNVARRDGLMEMEAYLCDYPPGTDFAKKFFKMAALYVIDDVNVEQIKKILENKIAVIGTETFKGYLGYLAMQGALAIQQCLNPRIVEEIMYSMVPENIITDIVWKIKELPTTINDDDVHMYIQKWDEYIPDISESKYRTVFENQILEYSDEQLKSAIAELKYFDMLGVLWNSGKDVKDKVSKLIPDKVKAEIAKDVQIISVFRAAQYLDTTAEIIKIIEGTDEILRTI